MAFQTTTELRRMARDLRAFGRQTECAMVAALTRMARDDVRPAAPN